MNDNISEQSDDEGRRSGWGACHSDQEAESESSYYTGRSFGKGNKLGSAWSWIEDSADFFRCGSSTHAVGTFADMLDSLVTDAVESYHLDSCRPGRARATREGEGKATDSVGTLQTETVLTQNDTSLNSILGPQPTRTRAWSPPPRLRTEASSRGAHRDHVRVRRASSFPKILGEAFYVSDVDTFLSDDLTDMEQGYFNGLYDHICSAIKTSKRSSSVLCSPRARGVKSVVLSFDDTISKLTMEDQRSCSTETLTALDRRATIAAIVRAQARGGWRAMAQEEAEAKAEELSRSGIDHSFAEPRLSPPSTPDENVIIVRHKLIPEPSKEQHFEDIRPNFFSSASYARADAPAEVREDNEGNEGIDANARKAFMSKKMRFLRPFHRKKKTDMSNSKESESGNRSSFLNALSSPRMHRHSQSQQGSPTSTTAPSTSPSTGTVSVLEEKSDGYRGAASGTRRDGPKYPAMFEEVEILAKRKEPVYSSYIRTPSYKIVEDVEILRKESDLSTLKQRGNNRRRFFYRSSLTSVDEETISRDNDLTESSSRRESESGSSYIADFATFEEDEGHYTATGGSSVDSSLKTMTSWLPKELGETEQFRRMLEEKDADSVLLGELLLSNESTALFEPVNSLPSAETLVQ
jgi:hypothetical protein